jgi:hypothetical protein
MDPSDTKKQRTKRRNQKIRKLRKQNKTVDIRDTNRYKHWEIRTLMLGMVLRYFPQAQTDLDDLVARFGKETGVKLFLDSTKN